MNGFELIHFRARARRATSPTYRPSQIFNQREYKIPPDYTSMGSTRSTYPTPRKV